MAPRKKKPAVIDEAANVRPADWPSDPKDPAVEPAKSRRGPKPWIPDADEIKKIESLSASGMTQAEICLALGIGHSCFNERKHDIPEISAAIKSGKVKANGVVHSKLMALIQGVTMKDKGGIVYRTAPNLGAIIWYEKTRRGMTDKIDVGMNAGVTIVWDKDLENI